jgi:hypothetical protein
MAKDRSLIDTFTELIYGPVSEYFRESGKDIVEGAAKGFISAQQQQQRKRTQQQSVKEVPYDFAALPVNYRFVGGVPIKINTLRVATFANSDSLYLKYAKLLQKGLDDNIVIPQSVNPGETTIATRKQKYGQGYA